MSNKMRTDFKCMYLIDERLYKKKIVSDEPNQPSGKSYYNITTPVSSLIQPASQTPSPLMKDCEVRDRIDEPPEKCLKNDQIDPKPASMSDLSVTSHTPTSDQITPLNTSMMDTTSMKSEQSDCDVCMTEKNPDEKKSEHIHGADKLKKAKSKIQKNKKIKKIIDKKNLLKAIRPGGKRSGSENNGQHYKNQQEEGDGGGGDDYAEDDEKMLERLNKLKYDYNYPPKKKAVRKPIKYLKITNSVKRKALQQPEGGGDYKMSKTTKEKKSMLVKPTINKRKSQTFIPPINQNITTLMCTICDTEFKSQRVLSNHVKRYHSEFFNTGNRENKRRRAEDPPDVYRKRQKHEKKPSIVYTNYFE